MKNNFFNKTINYITAKKCSQERKVYQSITQKVNKKKIEHKNRKKKIQEIN